MEFEEMQIIWNSQNNEKMYAINKAALFEKIRAKGRTVNGYVKFAEYMMIAINFGVSIWLLIDGVVDRSGWGQLVIAFFYLMFSVYAVYRWFTRRQDEKRFDETMLGELDKAIWRSNYLIRQGRDMIVWYLLPIVAIGLLFTLIEGGSVRQAALLILLVPLSYFGGRWEVRKWHAPRRRELEALRETLLSAEVEG